MFWFPCLTISQCFGLTVAQSVSVLVSVLHNLPVFWSQCCTISQCFDLSVAHLFSVLVSVLHNLSVFWFQCCTIFQCFGLSVEQFFPGTNCAATVRAQFRWGLPGSLVLMAGVLMTMTVGISMTTPRR